LEEEAHQQLKGKRWLLLHKADNLTDDERLEVEDLRHVSQDPQDLHDAWTMKEYLIIVQDMNNLHICSAALMHQIIYGHHNKIYITVP